MNYEIRQEIEKVFDTYLDAMEKQDSRQMQKIWRGSSLDTMFSVLGLYEGSSIVSELMETVLPARIAALHIGRSSIQLLYTDKKTAMVRAEYELILAYQDARSAAVRTMLETQIYENSNGTWKLAYIHQSFMPERPDADGEKRMDQALQGLLEWYNVRQDIPAAVPHSVREKTALLYENMQNSDLDPDDEYIALQETFLEERKRQREIRVVPYLLKENTRMAVVQNDPVSLAVDGLIAFEDKEKSFDPLLSLDAGLEMQRDIQAIMKAQPREILALSGYHLPVKGLVIVKQKPVYGLFTKAKQEIMLHSIRQALQKACDQGFRTIAVTDGWLKQLHIPLSFAEKIIREVWKYRNDFEAVIFTVSRSEDRKALQNALHTVMADTENPSA